MDEAKIASKIIADYGDVEIFLNIFDIFDNVQQGDVPMLREKVLQAALDCTRLLKADVITRLKTDRDLRNFMEIGENPIRFKR